MDRPPRASDLSEIGHLVLGINPGHGPTGDGQPCHVMAFGHQIKPPMRRIKKANIGVLPFRALPPLPAAFGLLIKGKHPPIRR